MPRPSMPAIVLALALTASCASPFDRDQASEPSDTPRVELSEPAAPLPASDQAAPTTTVATAEGAGSVTTTVARAPDATPTSSAAAPATRPGGSSAASVRQLAVTTDAAGDAGLGARGYGDLINVTFEEVGDTLRAIVDLGASVPTKLAEGEVEGIGVDIYRTADDESDFQLFADGGVEGWRAYLQTPDGFVQYPGDFSLGGSRLVFSVPWSTVGGRTSFRASVFADWSGKGTVLNPSSSDRAPDEGTIAVATRAVS